MQLTVSIPTRAHIVNGGFVVTIAPTGTQWLKAQLGDYSDKSGVYVFHANGKILYVGKTTQGKFGTFGVIVKKRRRAIANCTNVFVPRQLPFAPTCWTLTTST